MVLLYLVQACFPQFGDELLRIIRLQNLLILLPHSGKADVVLILVKWKNVGEDGVLVFFVVSFV